MKPLTNIGKNLNNLVSSQSTEFSSFTDTRDGYVYKTVKIGNQTWMAENLRYIPQLSPMEESFGAWIYDYNGINIKDAISTNYYKKYGCLYNLDTAKSVCPSGWHIPSDDEWTLLIYYLGGEEMAGDKLKSPIGWVNPNNKATNESGFSALPGGGRYKGIFANINTDGFWWSSTEGDLGLAIYRHMNSNSGTVERKGYFKSNGFSVRCVKNN